MSANVTFYTYPSCTSCRKTKKWLNSHSVDFSERHLFRETPTHNELIHLLSLTSEGLDELLATRSQSYKSLNIDIDELPLSQVVTLLENEPKLLRRPILTNGDKLVVGYDTEGLRSLTDNKNVLSMSS